MQPESSGPIPSLSAPLKEEAESRFCLPFLTILLDENEIGVNSINLITWKTGHLNVSPPGAPNLD